MKFEMSKKPLSIFSFSSLTDIVMLLLIFFLITSQFVVQTGVKVKLPAAKNNEQSIPSKLVVSVTASNKLYVGQQETTFQDIAGKLEELNSQGDNANLIIRADKTVEIESVIKVIDAAKGIGITKFTIETEKQSF